MAKTDPVIDISTLPVIKQTLYLVTSPPLCESDREYLDNTLDRLLVKCGQAHANVQLYCTTVGEFGTSNAMEANLEYVKQSYDWFEWSVL